MNTKKLETQVTFLSRRSNYALVGTQGIAINSGQKLRQSCSDEEIRRSIITKNQFIHSSVVFRNMGMRYSEKEKHIEDWALWMEILKKYKAANLNKEWVGIYILPERSSIYKSVFSRFFYIQFFNGLKLALKNRRYYPSGTKQILLYLLISVNRLIKYFLLDIYRLISINTFKNSK